MPAPAPAATPTPAPPRATTARADPESLPELSSLLDLCRYDDCRLPHPHQPVTAATIAAASSDSDLEREPLQHTRGRSRSLPPARCSPPMHHVFGRLIVDSETSRQRRSSRCVCASCFSSPRVCDRYGCPCELGDAMCFADDSHGDFVRRSLQPRPPPALRCDDTSCSDVNIERRCTDSSDIRDCGRDGGGDDGHDAADELLLADSNPTTAVATTQLCASLDRASSVLRTASLPASTSAIAQQSTAKAAAIAAAAAAAAPMMALHARRTVPQRHIRLAYHDEAVRIGFCTNAQQLIASVQRDPSSKTTSARLARKALRYRHVSLERIRQVDTLDPAFDVSAFFGVEWCKS